MWNRNKFNKTKTMDICIDFDGTCVTHEFPKVGKDIGAERVLRRLLENNHRLILFTMRSDKSTVSSEDKEIHTEAGNYLTNAVNWFKEKQIPLYGINVNPRQRSWTKSPKAYGQMYIDDCGIGCPLVIDVEISNKPFVNWGEVERILIEKGIICK
jgi:hypothetical protein